MGRRGGSTLLDEALLEFRWIMIGTNSTKWGPHDVAAAKAHKENTVEPEDKELIRSHHRSLAPCPFVYEATEPDGKEIWVVSIPPKTPVYDTHAGGREIHIYPEYLLPQLSQVYSGSREDPLPRQINPRRFLTASDLDLLRRFFPSAIGARVLISGFMIVLFRDRKHMKASWLEGCVPSFGLLRLGYDIAEHFPTETGPRSGNAVAKSQDESNCSAPLGLKLKFLDNSEGITVPTHAFVDVKNPRVHREPQNSNWLSKTKSAFSLSTVIRMSESIRLGVPMDCPLGKTAWSITDPQEKIGHISTTYDHHVVRSSIFPESIGHDISIVKGDCLPKICRPSRAPKIVDWGNYRDALDGKFTFAIGLNALSNKSTGGSGCGEFGTMQKVIVEGTEYLWSRKSRTQTAALIWRAMHEDTGMEGLSGSVLCLGERTDPQCRAVLFKNFETPICSQHFDCDRSARGDVSWSTFKGGFVLPLEIRNTEILCDGEESEAIPSAGQPWGLEAYSIAHKAHNRTRPRRSRPGHVVGLVARCQVSLRAALRAYVRFRRLDLNPGIVPTCLGISDDRIGLFMALTLVGDTAISFVLTLFADAMGRKAVLSVGSIMMAASGVVFALVGNFWILLLAAIFGVISPSGNDLGPFRAVEESTLAHLTPQEVLSDVLAWYSLLGTAGTALGQLVCGWVMASLQSLHGWEFLPSCRLIFLVYGIFGILKLILTLALSKNVEASPKKKQPENNGETRPLLADAPSEQREDSAKTTIWSSMERELRSLVLSLFFFMGLDAFASGLAALSWMTYFFREKFSIPEGELGTIFFVTSSISAVSILVASSVAKRLGNVKTMAFTHLPSAICLLLVPVPAQLPLALTFLVLRACSQSMDVAPRSAFLAAVLPPDRRTAIMGAVNVVKTITSSIAPLITGILSRNGKLGISFMIAGSLKVIYDLGILFTFASKEAAERKRRQAARAADEEAE
ncbi:hypothetical protein N7468_008953 [Penicillium chermesinum]|uniref:Major facilitator superfamily (MFS) profile domain-containing protein n=1 Tax=Penicillium chermesinum TaxID=63820 RepID=A0A9W9NGW1_9EURO|nr:uncharacterized protein N7468_008953 [Penicillium chermesinum]KAJ5219749.1 hypothetical protein N7468_008953 [Penicillium chermesinum]